MTNYGRLLPKSSTNASIRNEKIKSKLFRPSEVNYLKGNFSKAKKKLKWSPKTNLKKLVKIMVSEELKYYIKKN